MQLKSLVQSLRNVKIDITKLDFKNENWNLENVWILKSSGFLRFSCITFLWLVQHSIILMHSYFITMNIKRLKLFYFFRQQQDLHHERELRKRQSEDIRHLHEQVNFLWCYFLKEIYKCYDSSNQYKFSADLKSNTWISKQVNWPMYAYLKKKKKILACTSKLLLLLCK